MYVHINEGNKEWIRNKTNQGKITNRKQRTTMKIMKTATQTPALIKSIEYCSVTASSDSSSTGVTDKHTKGCKVKWMFTFKLSCNHHYITIGLLKHHQWRKDGNPSFFILEYHSYHPASLLLNYHQSLWNLKSLWRSQYSSLHHKLIKAFKISEFEYSTESACLVETEKQRGLSLWE